MNDAATVFGKPTAVTVGGKTYQFHPTSFDDHGDVQTWLDEQQKDPFAIVQEQIAKGRFSVEIQKYMVKSALELASRSRVLVGSPEADALLDSVEGKAFLIYLSIKKGDPKFKPEQAVELLRQLDHEARTKAIAAADVLRADDPNRQRGGKRRRKGGGSKANPPAGSNHPSTGGESSGS